MIKINMSPERIYKIGSISLIVVGISYIIGALLSLIIGPAPSGAVEYMNALAAHKVLSITNFAFFLVADIFLVPAALTLYLALRGINKKAMVIASALLIIFAVFDAGITELNSLELVSLTQNLATATIDAQRSAIMIVANNLLSTLPISTLCSFVISSVGLMISALVMFKGSFSKRVALPGLIAGIAGTLGGFYIIVPFFSILIIPSLFAMGIWGIFAGRAIRSMKMMPKAQPPLLFVSSSIP